MNVYATPRGGRSQATKMGRVIANFDKFPEASLFFIGICLLVATPQAKHSTTAGFVSIDCGSSVTSYRDSVTNLTWENDDNYILTGSNGAVPNQIDPSLDNSQALKSFRYFPTKRNKHCYVLPVLGTNVSTVIRAMFFHGNAFELPEPIEFDVSVNATIWFTFKYPSAGIKEPVVREGIFLSPAGYVYVCLLPKQGVPFISSLEMRPIEQGHVMYNFGNQNDLYLSTLMRLNTGPPLNAPTVRYPQDEFDRLWLNSATQVKGGGTNSSEPLNATSANDNSVPLIVMSDCWDGSTFPNNYGKSIGEVAYVFLDFNLTFPATTDNRRYVYAVFYFAAPNEYSTGQDTNIELNGVLISPPFNVSGITVRPYEHVVLPTNQVGVVLYSSTYPILNALEFYEENIVDPTITDDVYETIISFFKRIYKMEDWQGDPCAPVSYEWLTCEPRNSEVPFVQVVTSIALSNLNDSGSLLGLRGVVWSVNSLSLTHSNINDSILNFLVNNVGTLGILDLSHNFISDLQWVSSLSSLVSLNLSYNRLKGEVPSFVNVSSADTMQQLNLSHNALSFLPESYGNKSSDPYVETHVLDSLTVLDLSHNNISSNISLLNQLVLRNNLSLQELYISDNDISGEFPSEVYFDALKTIKILNLDHNYIGGVLDLSFWHKNLQFVLNRSANGSLAHVNQIFSFLNNSITGISPSIDVLQPTIEVFLRQQDNLSSESSNDIDGLRFNTSGVLLGGNPYCKNPKSRSQQYLCRFSLNDRISGTEDHKNNKTLVIVAAVGGAFLFLCSCIFIVTTWKLTKKVRFLQSIQQALADQKVQPPFYSYHNLKVATRDFHKDSILGKGGFGEVYKGVLPDGTAIAVKKLFNSNRREQVLNEFLNEVVLITGIKHRNLVQLRGCCIKERERILVYDYVERGNLEEALWDNENRKMLDWKQRFNICVNIARGLAYLHEELQPRIIHRDMKAANILLDKNFNPKIADFGLAKSILEEETRAQFTQLMGTRGYIAPEYASEGHLTAKADVFSFGILVLEIVSGRKCLDSTFPEDQVYIKNWAEKLQEDKKWSEILQFQLRNSSPEMEVEKVINIALICAQFNPKFRPKMSQVVTMFLGNIDLARFLNTDQHHLPDFDEIYSSGDDIDSGIDIKDELESPLLPQFGNMRSKSDGTSRTNEFGSRAIELRSMSHI